MSEQRAKREKKDKHGRFAALQRLAELKQKGSKHKYEVSEMENVYDTVDEKEYVKEVMSRNDDWIVDDNGSGYIEDGRDIFDDDLDSESIAAAQSSKKLKGEKRKKRGVSDNAGKGNLHYMLSNMPTKKKEDVKLDDDDVLSELISELDDPQEMTSFGAKKPRLEQKPKPKVFSPYMEKKAVNDYLKKSFAAIKLPIEPKLEEKENKPDNIIEVEHEEVIKIVEAAAALQRTEEPAVVEQGNEEGTVEQKTVAKVDNKTTEDNSKTKVEEIEKEQLDSEMELDTAQLVEEMEEMKQIDTNAEDLFDDDLDMSMIIDEDFSLFYTDETGKGNEEVEYKPTEDEIFPTFENEDGKEVFRFFWWDAYEDVSRRPGSVYLFGKTFNEKSKSYVSCCVAVNNIDRKIFLLPRQCHLDDNDQVTDKPVTIKDVYDEFNNKLVPELGIRKFKSRKVTRNYAFDPTIPAESEYLEVRYSAKGRRALADTSGKTFSQIFGATSSFLEILLLDRKLKGPCWIDIIDPGYEKNPLSRCRFEVVCNDPANLILTQLEKNLSPPPLVVAAINMQTMILPESLTNQIVVMSCLVQTRYAVDKPAPKQPFDKNFCVICCPQNMVLPLNFIEALKVLKGTKIQKLDSEKAMINYFFQQVEKIDPDLIVGFDINIYQTNLLAQKVVSQRLLNVDKLTKLKRSGIPHLEGLKRDLFVGRLVCDIKLSAKELIKARSYDFDTLCQTILKIPEGKRVELESTDVAQMFTNNNDILRLITLTMQDTGYVLKMMYDLNAIPLALQITSIAGNLMSKTLLGGRSERNEFLLLHAFTEKDYIVPDKRKREDENDFSSKSSRKQPSYAGGMVLDPKRGFYDNFVLLMDFNSLYPSIIQEYNICFTTIRDGDTLPDKSVPAGILPTEIRKLVESRRAVKKLMSNPDLSEEMRMQYDIRQMALKLTANSMYGCLGFAFSRFYAQNLAALVTKQGRDILMHTKDLVEGLNYNVVYGDTDSLMINTNCVDYDQVLRTGVKIKQEVNKLYRQIELDIDGVFKYLLLLKKKKYAAVTITKTKNGELKTSLEYKGLDIVRRDWARIAAEAGKVILGYILSDVQPDQRNNLIYDHLAKIKEDLLANRVPLQLLSITKMLGKAPEKYSKKVDLPHVLVALRHNKKGGKPLGNGDAVSYIICEDGTDNSPVQRAYLIEEMKGNDKLKVDINYYFAQQIFPVITRLCEPIEGIDPEGIADSLGLDKSVFISFKKPKSTAEVEKLCRIEKVNRETQFRNVDPFIFKCFSCKTEISVKKPFVDGSSFLDKCANSDCKVRPIDYVVSIQNQLSVLARSYIKKYQTGTLICEDPACDADIRRLPLFFSKAYPVCPKCTKALMYRKYTERDLYMQLSFFRYLFDLSKHGVVVDHTLEAGFGRLKAAMDNVLKHSAYWIVDLSKLFIDRSKLAVPSMVSPRDNIVEDYDSDD